MLSIFSFACSKIRFRFGETETKWKKENEKEVSFSLCCVCLLNSLLAVCSINVIFFFVFTKLLHKIHCKYIYIHIFRMCASFECCINIYTLYVLPPCSGFVGNILFAFAFAPEKFIYISNKFFFSSSSAAGF